MAKPVISQQYAEKSRLNLKKKASFEIVSIIKAQQPNVLERATQLHLLVKSQCLHLPMSESKPITITNDEYDVYQRYRSAIESDSTDSALFLQRKGEIPVHTLR